MDDVAGGRGMTRAGLQLIFGAVGASIVVGLVLAGVVSAQPAAPIFVRDSAGGIWLVVAGERYAVPLDPLPPDQVDAIPDSGRVVVLDQNGAITLVPREQAGPPPTGSTPPQGPRPDPKVGESRVFVGTGNVNLRYTVTVNTLRDPLASERLGRPEGRWVGLEVTVRNEGSAVVGVNPLDFQLQTVEGYIIENRPKFGLPGPELPRGELSEGQVARGWVAFDVPTGQKLVSVLYQPGLDRRFVIVDLTS